MFTFESFEYCVANKSLISLSRSGEKCSHLVSDKLWKPWRNIGKMFLVDNYATFTQTLLKRDFQSSSLLINHSTANKNVGIVVKLVFCGLLTIFFFLLHICFEFFLWKSSIFTDVCACVWPILVAISRAFLIFNINREDIKLLTNVKHFALLAKLFSPRQGLGKFSSFYRTRLMP